jgi:uncharacterized membrane protein
MNIHKINSPLPLLGQRVVTYLIIGVLAWLALHTGIRGLRYFVHFPVGKRIPWLLLPHIGTGFVALVVGPWQFWAALRKRYLHLHRWMGRIYVMSVAISSTTGLYLAAIHPNLHFRMGIGSLAIAWIITGTLAYLTIRRGLVQEHREWMILNYVLTWAFVTFRLGNTYLQRLGYDPGEALVFVWLCWVPQLLLTSLILRLSRSPLSARSQSANTSTQRPIVAS